MWEFRYNCLATMPKNELANFLIFLLFNIIERLDQQNAKMPNAGLGLRLLVQVILRRDGSILSDAMESIKSKFFSNKQLFSPKLNKPGALTPVFTWCFAQANGSYPTAAFEAWGKLLLPLVVGGGNGGREGWRGGGRDLTSIVTG
eukprot:TRINITY_DN3252_c0_g1_i13.p1 TRINITY_DN3252_c0_g1~~TRINITY_DN3252_c0_g1_i13.p1  ORF type:complete len:145 (-),score=30.60 TRINITY_DN3252_c0_g1_i13:449-883(-)